MKDHDDTSDLRMSVVIDEKTLKFMQYLDRTTKSKSRSELVRRAIQVYTRAVELSLSGHDIFYVKPEGEVRRLKLSLDLIRPGRDPRNNVSESDVARAMERARTIHERRRIWNTYIRGIGERHRAEAERELRSYEEQVEDQRHIDRAIHYALASGSSDGFSLYRPIRGDEEDDEERDDW